MPHIGAHAYIYMHGPGILKTCYHSLFRYCFNALIIISIDRPLPHSVICLCFPLIIGHDVFRVPTIGVAEWVPDLKHDK